MVETMLLAQAGWGLLQWAIVIVVLLAAVALVMVAVRAFGVTLPQWFIQVLMILLVAIVIIVALKFLFTML